MPQTGAINLSEVSISDAKSLARHVDIPAHLNSPLRRVMFPGFDSFSDSQREEVLRWTADALEEDAFAEPRSAIFLEASLSSSCRDVRTETNKQRKGTETGTGRKRKWVPATLDWDAWTALSQRLRAERERVLSGLDKICRLTSMSVAPDYQRRGIGPMMMQRICQDMDRDRRYGYVLAAPEAVKLYAKFGFDIVGKVETPYGDITSMLRQPVPMDNLKGEL
ncbi:hypothetical protein QBC46DRAFT_341963 [Diplogelasinospora grovesii]|uniref:N-acetyltransferase domain-containing protein n=1 Tax=Diplogelasinospora grovesii TaxID=303347 RepID=A0AAN6N6E5_9PEZI|nr:hypothetical protein QBC46DRAFT_341963 [Diplogelasinospora grovesii]